MTVNRDELENMMLKALRDVLNAYLAENPNGKYISMHAVLNDGENDKRWVLSANNMYWGEDQNFPISKFVLINKDELDVV